MSDLQTLSERCAADVKERGWHWITLQENMVNALEKILTSLGPKLRQDQLVLASIQVVQKLVTILEEN